MVAAIKAQSYVVDPQMIACFTSLKIQPSHLRTRHKELGEIKEEE